MYVKRIKISVLLYKLRSSIVYIRDGLPMALKIFFFIVQTSLILFNEIILYKHTTVTDDFPKSMNLIKSKHRNK